MSSISKPIVYVMGITNCKLAPESAAESKSMNSDSNCRDDHQKCYVPVLPILLDYRFESIKDCPYQPQREQDKAQLNQTIQQYQNYFPPVKNINQQRLLSDFYLEYFKAINPANPNVTLFIHGYNVARGYCGDVIVSDRRSNLEREILQAFGENPWENLQYISTAKQAPYTDEALQQMPKDKTNNKLFCLNYRRGSVAPIYRDFRQCREHFKENINDIEINEAKLNGAGAHNWMLHMEYNLNKAAGFKGFDYFYDDTKPQYTRTVNINWMGNPSNPADYIAVEPIAIITAKGMLPLIKQLKEAGIKINIIAHSAGNIVLVHLMNELGKLFDKPCLDNVFLWEAAIPDVALSPDADKFDKSLYQRWHTQHAYKAANSIHVLYSHHDNVLGPTPITTKGQHQADIGQKLASKVDDAPAALMALSIDVIDDVGEECGIPNAMKSIYNMAQMFGMPLQLLLSDEKARKRCYQQIYVSFHDKKPGIDLRPTLDEQVRYVKIHFADALIDLSLFVSLYVSILHHSWIVFLKSPEFSDSIKHLQEQLSADEVKCLQQELTRAVNAEVSKKTLCSLQQKLVTMATNSPGFYFLQIISNLHQWLHLQKAVDLTNLAEASSQIPFFLDIISHYAPALARGLNLVDEMATYFVSEERTLLQLCDWYQDARHCKSTKLRPIPAVVESSQHPAIISGRQIATLAITVFMISDLQPRPAMGWGGPDQKTITQLKKKGNPIDLINQDKYLFTHSGMKIPSKELMQNIYLKRIIQCVGDYQFGGFPKQSKR